MHYFFGEIDKENNLVYLPDKEAHHCAVVLRLKKGDKIGILFSREEQQLSYYIGMAELIDVHKKRCVAKITSIQSFFVPKSKYHIVISPPKNLERLEWMVEKLVELQASSILFVKSERCIRKKLNLERLNHIALSAAKQSGNPVLVEMKEYKDISVFVNEYSHNNKHSLYLLLHCYESEKKIKMSLDFLLSEKEKKYSDIYVFIGPEGDWTLQEINEIKSSLSNVVEIDMGQTRLRTETAAISMLSILRWM